MFKTSQSILMQRNINLTGIDAKTKISLNFLGFLLWQVFPVSVQAANLNVELKLGGAEPTRVEWTASDFNQLKNLSGKKKSFAEFLEKSLAKLELQQRATVDLIILRSRKGESAFIPRTFINRNGLVWFSNSEVNGPELVWSTEVNKAVLSKTEKLPLDQFAKQDVTEVRFSSYQTVFGEYFLKKRSDPRSIKGERLLVQNCLGCHGVEPLKVGWTQSHFLETLNQTLGTHPKVVGFSTLVEDELKSIQSYRSARQQEFKSQASGTP